jgi:hypothetical protein
LSGVKKEIIKYMGNNHDNFNKLMNNALNFGYNIGKMNIQNDAYKSDYMRENDMMKNVRNGLIVVGVTVVVFKVVVPIVKGINWFRKTYKEMKTQDSIINVSPDNRGEEVINPVEYKIIPRELWDR